MTVYQRDQQFFISGNNGFTPISPAVVNQWREEGEDVQIVEVEAHD